MVVVPKKDKHPLPSVENTLGQLAGAKVFSKLDADICLEEQDKVPGEDHPGIGGQRSP